MAAKASCSLETLHTVNSPHSLLKQFEVGMPSDLRQHHPNISGDVIEMRKEARDIHCAFQLGVLDAKDEYVHVWRAHGVQVVLSLASV